jgi:hypothetical protein
MSEKKTTIRFSKEDLYVLDKLSKINDKCYISPDKIQIIDGTLKDGGDSDNRFRGGTRTAVYKLSSKFVGMVDDLGITNLPSFINLVKSFDDNIDKSKAEINKLEKMKERLDTERDTDEIEKIQQKINKLQYSYVIDVYDKYIVIRDDLVNFKFWLTPSESKIIPIVDAENMIDKAEKTKKENIRFTIGSQQLQKIFDMQRIVGTFNIFFAIVDDEVVIKVANDFSENGNNSATVKIPSSQIIQDSCTEALKNGKFNKFEYIRNDYIVPDSYDILLTENAMLLKGKNSRTSYIVKASVV